MRVSGKNTPVTSSYSGTSFDPVRHMLVSRIVSGWDLSGLLERQMILAFNKALYRGEARSDIFDYIEIFYNRKRHHSYIGQHSPYDFEKLLW